MALNRIADRDDRRRQPAHRVPRAPGGRALASGSSGLFLAASIALFLVAAAEPQPPHSAAFARGPGSAPSLLVHEALHGALPPRPRSLPRDRARRRLDRRAGTASRLRRSSSASPSSSGRPVSTSLRPAGRGVRPPVGAAIASRRASAHAVPLWISGLFHVVTLAPPRRRVAASREADGSSWPANRWRAAAALAYQHAIVKPGDLSRSTRRSSRRTASCRSRSGLAGIADAGSRVRW